MARIVYHSRIAKLVNDWVMPIDAVTIKPWVFVVGGEINLGLLRHEMIHLEQQAECGLAWFAVLYVWYYLKNRAKGLSHFKAYMSIPFEGEAYGNMWDGDYLAKRKRGAWKDYR